MNARSIAVAASLLGLALARPCAAEEGEEKLRAADPSGSFVLGAGWGRAVGGRSVSRDAADVSAEIVLGRRVALGLSTSFYAPFDSYAPSGFPMSERLLAASGHVRIAVLGPPAGGHGVYVRGGVGAIWTRPVSLVDPEHRDFDYMACSMFALGVGARVFFTARTAVAIELRDSMYIEHDESAVVAPGSAGADPTTWYGTAPLTNLVELRLGVSWEIPPS